MNKQTIINELKELGFNEYKAKVLLVLLNGSAMSASEIAKEAKIIRSSIYDVLKLFVEKGYCNEIETNRILLYQIIDPEIILDKLEREYTSKHNKTMSQLKKTFGELKNLYDTGSAEDDKTINIELIRGYNQHRISKYIQMLKKAKKEILGMYRFKGLVMEESDKIAENFIKKGGTIKSIYQINLDFKIQKGNISTDAKPEDLVRVCESFELKGEQIRLSEMNIPNMTIIDGENVFINLDDQNISRQSRADVIFRRSGYAKNMIDLFNYYWNNSYTLDEYKKNNL